MEGFCFNCGNMFVSLKQDVTRMCCGSKTPTANLKDTDLEDNGPCLTWNFTLKTWAGT